MKKIRKALLAVFKIIQNPWLLNRVLTEDKIWSDHLNQIYGKNYSFPMVGLDQLTDKKEHKLRIHASLDGGSLPTDLLLLKVLCEKFDDCSYFEIGTWRGESAINVADVSKEVFTFNLSKEMMIQKNIPVSFADLIGFYSKKAANITHLEGDSFKFDFGSLNKKFDVIFIDGDHSYEGVKQDSKKVFEHLVHEKSIVVWHDYGNSPEALRNEVISGILDGTPEKKHANLYHVANTKSAIFFPEKLRGQEFYSPQTPELNFELSFKMERLNQDIS